MNNEKGFILMMTLCITVMMSLFLLSSMHHVLLYQRAAARQELRHQHFYQLERLARQLMSTQQPECLRVQNAANQIIQQLLQQQGCVVAMKKTRYQYLIEDLGVYSCLLVNDQGITKATHHFRVTVLAQDSASLVQIRFIKAASEPGLCRYKKTYTTLGISSWRYLADLSLTL